jgi:hypothetical protein
MGTIYGLIRYFDSKRFWAPLGATAILATATVAWAVPPASVFELDGDVADAPGNTIADWNTLNGDCAVPGGRLRVCGGFEHSHVHRLGKSAQDLYARGVQRPARH